MSEPPTADIKSAGSAEVSTDEDKTQPLSEILNSLNQLKAETNEVRPTLQEDTPVPLQVPISEWDTLRTQLRENPQDPDGWRKLVDLAEDSGDIEKVKETYDGLLEIYPNTVCDFRCGWYTLLNISWDSPQHRSRISVTS
jgi:cleavage stimulation factor subunit 3